MYDPLSSPILLNNESSRFQNLARILRRLRVPQQRNKDITIRAQTRVPLELEALEVCRQLKRFEESIKGEGFANVLEGCDGFCCIICVGADVGGEANDTLFGCEGGVEDLADARERGLVELLAFEAAFDEIGNRLQSTRSVLLL